MSILTFKSSLLKNNLFIPSQTIDITMYQSDELKRFLITLRERTKSKGKLNFFSVLPQQKLPPKLPVPNVERTLSRYLDAVRAFIPEPDLKKSEKIVQNFLNKKDDVEAIEAKLRLRSEEVENWVKKTLFLF